MEFKLKSRSTQDRYRNLVYVIVLAAGAAVVTVRAVKLAKLAVRTIKLANLSADVVHIASRWKSLK